MFLVDTSVWVDWLRGRRGRHVARLDELLGNPVAVTITDVVLMEVLQGARDDRAFDRLRSHLEGLPFARFADPVAGHAEAARLYLDCRGAGVTVRSSVECLIAQTAIEHDLVLLHNDRDFARMGEVRRRFRQLHFIDRTRTT